MKLMIVESPNKVAKITKFLGPGWMVMASVGHIRDLPPKAVGITAPDYRLEYELTERGRDIVRKLKSAIERAAEGVYLATDPDREGEAISWHLAEALGARTYHRVTFNAITEEAVLAAVRSPRKIDFNLVQAQDARRGLDRLVGWRVSPALSDQTGLRLGAGRVQSPAVRLVVEREREITAFKVTEHFGASVSFDNESWRAEWVTKPHLADDAEYLTDKALAEQAAACRQFNVTACETKPERKAPPAPFTTSSLLQAASVTLKLKPEQAMEAAQKLFEGGHITYHRTDSQNLSAEAVGLIQGLASGKGWDLPDKPRIWASKDGTQEAHEAIRPTHFEVEAAGDDEAQRGLYRLIWQRAVASQLADAEYAATTIDLDADNGGTTFRFRARGAVLTKQSWKALTTQDAAEEAEEGEGADNEAAGGQVPSLEVGSAKIADSGKLLAKKTRPPTRYSQAGLIKKLEVLGIGRPSTYAATLKNIMAREYVSEQKRFLIPTSAGNTVVDGLCGRFSFVEYAFTKEMEERLDDIAAGKAAYVDVISKFDQALSGELTALSASGAQYPCPDCGRALRKIMGKRGAFWGCSGYRDGCAVICKDEDGKPGAVSRKSDGPLVPSDKQLAYAKLLSEEKGKAIPENALTDAKALSAWIDELKTEQAASGASQKQMHRIRLAVVDDGEPPPPGYPDNVSLADATAFLDRYFKNKKSGTKKPAKKAGSRK